LDREGTKPKVKRERATHFTRSAQEKRGEKALRKGNNYGLKAALHSQEEKRTSRDSRN